MKFGSAERLCGPPLTCGLRRQATTFCPFGLLPKEVEPLKKLTGRHMVPDSRSPLRHPARGPRVAFLSLRGWAGVASGRVLGRLSPAVACVRVPATRGPRLRSPIHGAKICYWRKWASRPLNRANGNAHNPVECFAPRRDVANCRGMNQHRQIGEVILMPWLKIVEGDARGKLFRLDQQVAVLCAFLTATCG
jgi:hypothetical protein